MSTTKPPNKEEKKSAIRFAITEIFNVNRGYRDIFDFSEEEIVEKTIDRLGPSYFKYDNHKKISIRLWEWYKKRCNEHPENIYKKIINDLDLNSELDSDL